MTDAQFEQTDAQVSSSNGDELKDDTVSFDEEDERSLKPWDEGGASDCGYSDTVHSTLMSVGEKVHTVIGGGPGREIGNVQKSIGNWFQELSYATRDILRGDNTEEMQQDAAAAVNELMTGGTSVNDEALKAAEERKENSLASS